jgi:hypothetical protein
MRTRTYTVVERQRALEVHERVGRNVIRVQILEGALKSFVPVVDLQGARHALDGLPERTERALKQTLGQLIGSFQASLTSSDEAFDHLLSRVVADRNDLVHHFPAKFGSMSRTEEGHSALLRKLDYQLEEIKSLERLVHGLLLGFLKVLRDNQAAGSEGYRDFASIHDEVESAIRVWSGEELRPEDDNSF